MTILKKLYNNHYTVLLSMALGIIFGITHKDLAHHYSGLGKIYLNLLQVSVIPLVIFTIIIGVFHIHESSKAVVSRASFASLFIILISVTIAISLTMLAHPWTYITDLRGFNSLFGDTTITKPLEMVISDQYGDNTAPGVMEFITKTIPSNIFNALNYSNMLQIVFASVIIGYGFYKVAESSQSIKGAKEKFQYGLNVFTTINNKIISFMPIGVFFLMSNQFMSVDFGALHALAILALTIISCLLLLIIFYIVIIWLKSGVSFLEFLKTFSSTFIILITTMSSIVALPKAMESLKRLKFSEGTIDMYMPFGVSLVRVGTMMFFSIATLFIMGLFDVSITFEKCLFISIASIFAAMSTVGTSGIVTLQMISIVLDPLGLPLGGVLAILVVIDAVVDIFDTFANLIGNAAVVALASEKE